MIDFEKKYDKCSLCALSTMKDGELMCDDKKTATKDGKIVRGCGCVCRIKVLGKSKCILGK